MSDKHGDFIWYELMSTDADAAKAFYGGLLGWQFADSGQSGMDYFIGSMNGTPVVGLMELTSEMIANGAHPLWSGYVSVDDVDDAAGNIKEAGGTVFIEPRDIPGIGRFAFVSDPQGVPLYVMNAMGEGSESFARYEPRDGHCAWNELITTDPDGAKAFYCELFKWEKADEMDMGKMGMYEMFRQNDYTLGAIMRKPDDAPVPMWIYYFRVADVDTAADYIRANGAELINGPMQIPGGEYIIHGLDPQKAFFALIGKRSEQADNT